MNSVVVVESPAKAKTIEGYLGDSYSVVASFGHVRDMEDKDGAVLPPNWSNIRWSLNKKGEMQVNEILSLLKKADHLILATDPDREGEAIAWHIYELLNEKDALAETKVSRAVFNSITKKSVSEAINNLRAINKDKVEAYLARRVLDYIVGFNVSPLLWRRLPGARSAGRVQSVALKLICERENEREVFEPQEYWSIEANFLKDKDIIPAQIYSVNGERIKKFDITNEDSAIDLSEKVKEAKFSISEINKKPVKRNPRPPFITSTLQQEAARKLRFSADQTMRTAQTLYEQAFITYMRTDSPVMDNEGIDQCRNIIKEKFGSNFLPSSPRVYKSKSKQAQEAHEAIRPTDFARSPAEIPFSGEEKQLYELIWNRAVSSQMESAQVTQTEVMIASTNNDLMFKATGSQVIFNGFLEVYEEGQDEEKEKAEPKLPITLNLEDNLEIDTILPGQHFTKPSPRYTEASLIKELEEKGIGRPSTYASIMNSIKKREYATLQNKQFIPSGRGRVVVGFLDYHFEEYFRYEFTADMEESLDEIAKGEHIWTTLLDKFWEGFSPIIESVKGLSNRQVLDNLNEHLKEIIFPVNTTCPKCTGDLTLKNSPKSGPFIGCSKYSETGCDYAIPAFLRTAEKIEAYNKSKDSLGSNPQTGKDIYLKPKRAGGFYLESKDDEDNRIMQNVPDEVAENMDLEEAIKWMNLPRDIGLHPDTGEMVQSGFTRKPVVRMKIKGGGDKAFIYVNLKNIEEIFDTQLNYAVDLLAKSNKKIEFKEDKELGKDPRSNLPVFIKDGPWGYQLLTDKQVKKNKGTSDPDFDEVTLEYALENMNILGYCAEDSRAIAKKRERIGKTRKNRMVVVHGDKKIEIKKPFNSISLQDAIELIKCEGNPDEDTS
ncbi:MAG: type I DNA topoisomerase [Gammaproteobacteria bacterium]